jgi:hypothetical protein
MGWAARARQNGAPKSSRDVSHRERVEVSERNLTLDTPDGYEVFRHMRQAFDPKLKKMATVVKRTLRRVVGGAVADKAA